MKTKIVTSYGTLSISTHWHPMVDDLVVTVGGDIRTPNRHPAIRGESIALNYRHDPAIGWHHVGLDGHPWSAAGTTAISLATREINAAVERWLAENHSAVKTQAVRDLERKVSRERAASSRALAMWTTRVRDAEARLAEVRKRM
jgi:hypothetical protein